MGFPYNICQGQVVTSYGVSCTGNLSYGNEERNREIDVEGLFRACTKSEDVKCLHALLAVSGKAKSSFVATRLINMYSYFGNVSLSRDTFDQVRDKDSYTWNSMISAYVRNRQSNKAVKCVSEMLSRTDVRPDFHTIPTVLKACSALPDEASLHYRILKSGFEWDVFVAASLVHMYCRFGFADRAYTIFKDMPSRDTGCWNSMISGYFQNGNAKEALSILDDMILEGVKMDSMTVATILSVDLLRGMLIHLFVIKHGLAFHVFVSNALINMYSKLGELKCVPNVFDHVYVRDIVSWNSVIAAYEQNNHPYVAIKLFHRMHLNKVQPDLLTLVSLSSCVAQMKDPLCVKCLREYCVLINLYGKCGRLSEAIFLFYQVCGETSVPWNAIMSCHGLEDTSLKYFEKMLNEEVKPTHVTFLSLLNACSHSGLVDQGKWCFQVMQQEYEIIPTLKHYGCMVDMFGRVGLLETAYNFIESMPIRPDASVWGPLLGACRIHGNVEMGRKASSHLFELDSQDVGHYVLLSNLYANFGRWEGVNEVRSLARDRGLWKTPGWSSIELNSRVEVFYSGNQSHPQYGEILKELGMLNAKIKSLGYIPDTSFVLQDVEADEKENILPNHSERLAIVFGILNTPPKTCIRIYKNLCVCGDCHNVTKLISKLTEREIIVRDSNRFHHFKDGLCSCGDYW
uniref:Pentatricopeptide repeat protein n=1 Tax=Salvia miltiorrhiza TaxID=226208 RepID=A0A678WDG1_SALMI|nr:pentatricopeptide repeat protein [Salvia miltiorrhiza]